MHNRHSSSEYLQIESRRLKVAELILKGVTAHAEICRRLGMDPGQRSTVTRDVQALNGQWRDRAAAVLDEAKGRELARLDLVEQAAWAAWEKSQQNAETLRARVSGGAQQTEKVSKGQAGDPQFLRVVLGCVEQRRALLGLDPPKESTLGLDLRGPAFKLYAGFDPEAV